MSGENLKTLHPKSDSALCPERFLLQQIPSPGEMGRAGLQDLQGHWSIRQLLSPLPSPAAW